MGDSDGGEMKRRRRMLDVERKASDAGREEVQKSVLSNSDLDKFFSRSTTVDFADLDVRELSVFEEKKQEYLDDKFWMTLQYRMHKLKLYILLASFSVCYHLVSLLGIQKWAEQVEGKIDDVKARLVPDWLAQVRHRMNELLEGIDEENVGIHKVGEHSGTGHGPPFDPRKFNEAVIAEGGLSKIEQLRQIASGEYFDNHPDSRENKLKKTKIEKGKERAGAPSVKELKQDCNEDSDTSEDSSSVFDDVDYGWSPNIAIGDHEQ